MTRRPESFELIMRLLSVCFVGISLTLSHQIPMINLHVIHYDPNVDDPPHMTNAHGDSDPSQPLYPTIPTGTSGPVAHIHPTDTQKEAMEKIFRDVAGDDMEIDWMELKRILDQTMRDEFGPHQMSNDSLNAANGGYDGGGPDDSSGGLLASLCGAFCKGIGPISLGQPFHVNETNNNSQQPPITAQTIESSGFSKDVCRSMVAMLDIDQSGKLGLGEFQQLMTDLAKWRVIFKVHDRDDSGKLSTFELRDALESTGYNVSNRVLNALAHRYGTRDGNVAFDDFIMCAVKIKTMMDLFAEHDINHSNTATFTLDEWMAKTLYS